MSHNVLGSSHREIAGSWLRGHVARGLTQNFAGNIHVAPTVSISGTEVEYDGEVFLIDLAFLSDILGAQVDGLLGAPFLEKHVIEVRAPEKTVCIYDSLKKPIGEVLFEVWPTDEGLPAVEGIIINGEEFQFIFDTGYNGGLAVLPPLFEQLMRNGHISHISHKHVNDGTKTRSGRLKAAKVWGCNLVDVPISESGGNLVGMAIIEKFSFTLSLSAKRVALTPSCNWKDPFKYDRSGLHLISQSDKIVVFAVRGESAASRAGIRSGDVLIKVNQSRVQGHDIGAVRIALSDPTNDIVAMEINRGDIVFDAGVFLE